MWCGDQKMLQWRRLRQELHLSTILYRENWEKKVKKQRYFWTLSGNSNNSEAKGEEMTIMRNNTRNRMVLEDSCGQGVCTGWCHGIHTIILEPPIPCDREKWEGFSRNIQTGLKWHFPDSAGSLLTSPGTRISFNRVCPESLQNTGLAMGQPEPL